MRVGFCL